MLRFLFLCLALMAARPLPASELAVTKGSVVVAPVGGAITEAQFFFLRRVLKNAESGGAAALVLDMDTPGGALKATEQIVQMLMRSPVPTYTYVNSNAGSAGALIALGTKKVFMAPVSAIGAAAPVVSSGEEIPATMNAKIVSYYSGYFRSVAALNGYYPELVDGFMNLDKEVKVGGEVINPKGSLLTLSAQEAVREVGGRPLFASGIAKDLEGVCAQAGLDPGRILRVDPSGFEVLAQWITTLAPLFLLGGMIGAYLEFKSPGFGVAGALSAACFLLFFTGHYIAGLTGLEVVAVFALGALLILAELVFFPGVVVVAALGAALMAGSLFFAMVDYYPAQPLDITFDLLAIPMLNLGIAVVAAVLCIAVLARFLPDLPIFRRLFLSAQSAAGPSRPAAASAPFAPGGLGTAQTTLRPSGKALFGGCLADVVAEGEFLEAGTPVKILSVSGSRIVVTAAHQSDL
ncbi:MAG: NfeD family protein [Verrucomicrobiae bacterium]